jgi:hypothetical protein
MKHSCVFGISQELSDVMEGVLAHPDTELFGEREKAASSTMGVLGNLAAIETGNAAVAEHQDGRILKAVFVLLEQSNVSSATKSR